MFDLFRSREKVVRIMLGGILVIVAASMVTYLIPSFGSGLDSTADDPVLVQVGGHKLTSADFQKRFSKLSQTGQLPESMLQVYFPQYLDYLTQQLTARYQAERMGLTVSDDELLVYLMAANAQFFPGGVMGPEQRAQFDQYVTQQGGTFDDVIEEARQNLLVKKLNDGILESIVVTPQEVQAEFAKKNEKAKIAYIAFPPGKFSDQVKPSDDDLRKSFNGNRGNYTIPQKSSYQVVVLDQEKVEASLQFSDADLRAAYNGAMDNFRMPERIHARLILINTQGKSDAEKKSLKTKAEDLLKQVKGGADFADVARKNSQDTASAEKGGDLDWIVRGQSASPEFEAAAFALKPKEISGIITTEYGFQIVQLMEKEPARVKPFEEVKAGLAVDLRKQKVIDKMQASGDQIHAALQKSPGSAEAVAKQFGADFVNVPNANPGQPIPTLGASPEIDAVLANMKPNDVSQVQILPANRLAVVVLNSRTPQRNAEFDEVKDEVRNNYIQAQTGLLAENKAKEAAERVRAGEDMDKVAKSLKLELVTSSFFSRSDAVEGLGQAVYVEEAFGKPEGTVIGPAMIREKNENIIYKVVGKIGADPISLAAEKDAIASQLKERKAREREQLMLDSITNQLLAEGKMKRNDKEILRIMGTYAQK